MLLSFGNIRIARPIFGGRGRQEIGESTTGKHNQRYFKIRIFVEKVHKQTDKKRMELASDTRRRGSADPAPVLDTARNSRSTPKKSEINSGAHRT